MDFLFSTLQLLASLTILVFIHELGHFLAAKAFGMRVDKFYIFFDAWSKKIWSKAWGGTEYGIGWLPLGGYVKIHGMIDESLDKEQMNVEPGPDEFRSKPAWQRLVVMLGGVIFNVVLGVLIFTMIYKTYEKDYLPNDALTDGLFAHELAVEQGFQTGDKILTVNGKEVQRYRDAVGLTTRIGSIVEVDRNGTTQVIDVKGIPFEDFGRPFLSPNAKQTVSIKEITESSNAEIAGFKIGDVFKNVASIEVFNFPHLTEILDKNKGEEIIVNITRNEKPAQITAQVTEDGTLGFRPQIEGLDKHYTFSTYNIFEAVKYSMADGWETIYANVKGIGRMARGEESVRENIKSPIGMITLFPSTWDGRVFWRLTGLISFILAFMNLLPIPALDGGHATFLLWEMITRKKPSENFLMRAQVVGMIFLLTFMALALGNDIFNLVSGIFK